MADLGLASWLGATMEAPSQSNDANNRVQASSSSGAQDLAPKVAASDALAAALAKGNTAPTKAETKGFRLPSSTTATFDLDTIPSSHIQQIQVTTVAHVKTEYKERLLTQVASNATYTCYSLKLAQIRALSKTTGNKSLLKGHQPQVTDMQFKEGTNILASADEAGAVHVRALTLVDGSEAIQEEVLVRQEFGSNPAATRRLAWHPKLDSLLAVVGTNTISFVNVPPTAGVASSPEFSQPVTPAAPQTPGTFTCVDFSPAGDLLAAADDRGQVHVWLLPPDFQTKAQVEPLAVQADLVFTAYGDSQQRPSINFLASPGAGQDVLLTSNPTGSHLMLWSLQHPPLAGASSSSASALTAASTYQLHLQCAEGVFNHVAVQQTHGLVLLANTKKQQVYAIHVHPDPATSLPAMDYLTAFSVAPWPILSFALSCEPASQDENGQEVLYMYTQQTEAVQEYSLYPSACLPAADLEEEEQARQHPSHSADTAQPAAAAAAPIQPVIPPTLHMPQLATHSSQPISPSLPEPTHPALIAQPSDVAPAAGSSGGVAGPVAAAAPPEPHTPDQGSLGSSVAGGGSQGSEGSAEAGLAGVRTPPQLEPEVPAPAHGETAWETMMKKWVGPEAGGNSSGGGSHQPGPPPMIPASLLQAANRNSSYTGAESSGPRVADAAIKQRTADQEEVPHEVDPFKSTGRRAESIDSLGSDATSPGVIAPLAAAALAPAAAPVEPAAQQAALKSSVEASSALAGTRVVAGDDAEDGGESSAGSAPGPQHRPPPATGHVLAAEAAVRSSGGSVDGAAAAIQPAFLEGVGLGDAGAGGAADTTGRRRKKVTVNKTRDAAAAAAAAGGGAGPGLILPPPPPAPSPQLLKRSSTTQAAAAVSGAGEVTGSHSPASAAVTVTSPAGAAGLTQADAAAGAGSVPAGWEQVVAQMAAQQKESLKQLRSELRAEMRAELKAASKTIETAVRGTLEAGPSKASEKKEEQARAISVAVQAAVSKELSSKLSELQRNLVTQVSATLAATVRATVAETLPAASQQAVDKAVSAALRSALPRAVSDALKDSFASTVVPGVERATQVMFGQMQGVLSSALTAHQASLSELDKTVKTAASELTQLSATVRSELARLSSLAPSGSQSTARSKKTEAAPPPPAVDPVSVMKEHLKQRQFELAFNVALSSTDRAHLFWLLKQLDPLTVLGSPCLLSQGVILSLLSHLTLGLEADTERNLHWITEAANALDVTDVQCRSHARLVLEPLKRAVGQLSMTQAGEVGRAAKTCVHIVNSLLHIMAEHA